MAASDATPLPLKNTLYRHYFRIWKTDGTLLEEAWTGTAAVRGIDGAAEAATTNSVSQIGTTSRGYIELTASEMNSSNTGLKITVTNTNAVPYVVDFFPSGTGDLKADIDSIGGDQTSANNLKESAGLMQVCSVDTVTNTHTPTTTEFQSDTITEATADHYNTRGIFFLTGALQYQFCKITDYALVGGIGQFTVEALTEAPADNDTFIIV